MGTIGRSTSGNFDESNTTSFFPTHHPQPATLYVADRGGCDYGIRNRNWTGGLLGVLLPPAAGDLSGTNGAPIGSLTRPMFQPTVRTSLMAIRSCI